MGKFGWSLPPGCGKLPGEEDRPCEVCGRGADDCICPECQVCGVAGEPDCYLDEWRGGHGLTLTVDQKIGKAKMEIAGLQDQIASIGEYIWLLEREREAKDGND